MRFIPQTKVWGFPAWLYVKKMTIAIKKTIKKVKILNGDIFMDWLIAIVSGIKH